MANINVTYQDLNDAATRLAAGRDDLNQKLTELSALIDNLTSNGFQAEKSSAAYQTAYEQFTRGTRTAVDGLEGLSAFLTAAASALQQTDEGLATALQN